MKKKFNYEIYESGLKNDYHHWEIIGQKNPLGNRVQIILFLAFGIIFAKQSAHQFKNIAWINGNRGYEKYFSEKEYIFIYHGKYFKKFWKLRSHLSVLSFFNFAQRIGILLQSMQEYRNYKKSYLSYWLEFCYISAFYQKVKPNKIVTPHTNDRQSTWLSYLSKELSIEYEIYQHGVTTIGDNPPSKIYCTKFYAINKNEIDINKNFIVDKSCLCEFEIKHFVSTISFQEIETEKYVIGIATQCNHKYIEQIVESIRKNIVMQKICIVVMLHPLDKARYYKHIKGDDILIEKRNKYINLDLLITVNSTIVFDYNNEVTFKGEIILVDSKFTLKDSIKDFEKIHLFKTIEEAMMYITFVVSQNKKLLN